MTRTIKECEVMVLGWTDADHRRHSVALDAVCGDAVTARNEGLNCDDVDDAIAEKYRGNRSVSWRKCDMGKEYRAVPVHDATGKTFADLHAAARRQFGGLIFVMFPPVFVESVAGWLADNDDVDDGDFVICSSEDGATMYFRHVAAARRLCEWGNARGANLVAVVREREEE